MISMWIILFENILFQNEGRSIILELLWLMNKIIKCIESSDHFYVLSKQHQKSYIGTFQNYLDR